MFKVSNKKIRMTSHKVDANDFEQVNISWADKN